MNTSSLSVASPRQEQALALGAQARQLRERVALRAGLALVAWSRRQDEQRTSAAVQLRRRNEAVADNVRAEDYQRVALAALLLV